MIEDSIPLVVLTIAMLAFITMSLDTYRTATDITVKISSAIILVVLFLIELILLYNICIGLL